MHLQTSLDKITKIKVTHMLVTMYPAKIIANTVQKKKKLKNFAWHSTHQAIPTSKVQQDTSASSMLVRRMEEWSTNEYRNEKLQVHDRAAGKEVKRSWKKGLVYVVSRGVGITPEEFSRGLSRRGYYACLNVPRIRVRLPTRGDRPFNIAGIRLIYECPGYI